MTKWDKPLQGKNARLISTLDQPGWCYRFTFSRPSYQAMEQLTMCFTGGAKGKNHNHRTPAAVDGCMAVSAAA